MTDYNDFNIWQTQLMTIQLFHISVCAFETFLLHNCQLMVRINWSGTYWSSDNLNYHVRILLIYLVIQWSCRVTGACNIGDVIRDLTWK